MAKAKIHPKTNWINIVIKKSGHEDQTIRVLSTLDKDFDIYKDYTDEPAWNKDNRKKQTSSNAEQFNNKFGGFLDDISKS